MDTAVLSEKKQVESDLEDTERYIVPGLARGLSILRLFSSDRLQLGAAEIARELGISRSTVFRLVYTLESMGFLQRAEHSKKYQLGLKVLDLGFQFLSSMDIVDLSRPHLQQLCDETQVSSHLAVRDEDEIVYLSRISSKHVIGSTIGVGSRFPAHATTSGRIMLSDLPMSDIAALYEGKSLQTYTDQTPTTLGDLINVLEQDRKNGYVFSWGAFEKNLASIAVPLRDSSRKTVASINVSCSTGSYTKEELIDNILPMLIEKASLISSALGYRN
jgi:DNA-binding IclR family transcriptional regulator